MPHERDEEMRKHLEAWRVSNLTQVAYCQQHHIKPYILSYYKSKLGYGETPLISNGLLPVQVVAEQHAHTGITLKLPADISIEVPPGFDLKTLQQVLSLLR